MISPKAQFRSRSELITQAVIRELCANGINIAAA
jgi:hypothetical protein